MGGNATRHRQALRLVLLTVVCLAAVMPAANANQMTLFSCHDPSGKGIGHDGWVTQRTGDMFMTAADSCGGGGSGTMSLDLGANYNGYNGAKIEWVYQAPSWATIAWYILQVPDSYAYVYTGSGQGQAEIWASDESDPVYDYRNYGGGSVGAQTVARTPPAPVSSININASCNNATGPCPANAHIAHIDLAAATLVLDDSSVPGISGVDGTLATNQTLTGSGEINFTASDSGPGVYSAWLVVDGVAQAPLMLNTNGGQCVNQGQTNDGTRSFDHPIPCVKSTSASLTFDTTKLHDGAHTVKLMVDDASGNTAAPFSHTFTSENAPAVLVPPSISGVAKVGSILKGADGSFSAPSGAGAMSAISGEWLRCDPAGEKCAPISGASGSAYALTEEDVHHALVYENTVSDNDGKTVSDSPPSAEVPEPPSAGGSCSGSGCQQGGGGSSSTTTNNTTISSSSTNESLSNEALAIARGAANGSPASDQARIVVRWPVSASSARVGYGRKARAEGRLLAGDGRPIAGAVVDVIASPSSPGYASFLEGSVKTAGDGTFVFDTRARRPSRTLTFEYKSHVNDLSLAAQAQLSVGVPAPISLRVRPRTVRRGSVIRMSGSVPTPIPTAGKQIVLQALAVGVRGAGWQTFNVVRTDSMGQFRGKYRFRFSGPARYRIRALTRYEQDYPYLASTSKSALVYEH